LRSDVDGVKGRGHSALSDNAGFSSIFSTCSG